MTNVNAAATFLGEPTPTSNPALSNSPALKQNKKHLDPLAQLLSAGSSSAPSGAPPSKSRKAHSAGDNPPQWQGLKNGLVLIRRTTVPKPLLADGEIPEANMEPEATGRTNTKIKFNVEVNPLVVKEYQENNFLQRKWTSTAIHSSMPFISSPISR